jgi:probable O-glycosylation ligase (exosortase A-associated)
VHATATWWRPAHKQPSTAIAAPPFVPSGTSVAFGALVAFTAILLLSPQAWIPALQVLRLAFLAAILAMAAHVVERTIRRQAVTPVSPEIGLALALVCWSVLTIPMSYWPGGSVRMLLDHYLKAVVFFWLLGAIINSTERLRILAWTLVLCSIPLAAVGVNNYVAGEVLSTGVSGFYRITGYTGTLTTNPNDLALMLNLIIPIAGALVWASRRPAARVLALVALLLSVGAVIVTFSRAGFLTLAATALMLFVVLMRRRAPGAAGFLLVVALVAPVLMPAGYTDRLSTITDIETDRTGSAQGRWQDFLVATEIVMHNPIVGVGIGADMLALNEYRPGPDTYRSVHNAYLQYAVDLGLPGLILFVWLHIMCFRNARRVERQADAHPELRHLAPLAAGIQISLVGFFVAAMFHPIAYQFYFFTIAGLAVALKNTCRAELAHTQATKTRRHEVTNSHTPWFRDSVARIPRTS